MSPSFNDHDKIGSKEHGSKTLENVFFFMLVGDVTLKGLEHHGLISIKSKENKIGVWRIVKVANLQKMICNRIK
jgi:hypothetical protein